MRIVNQALPARLANMAAIGLLLFGTGLAWAQQSDNDLLEEVVVTARKVAENIQEVPVAITAVSAQLIDDLNLRNLDF